MLKNKNIQFEASKQQFYSFWIFSKSFIILKQEW